MSDTINIGGVTVSKFYLGGSSDVKIFLGTTKLYPQDTPVAKNYLRTVAKSSGTISLTIGSAVTTTDLSYVAYSLDSGDTWTTVNNANNTTVTASTSVSNGDVVYWKGEGTRISNGAPSYSGVRYATSFSSTAQFDVEGNAMSMLFGDNFENQEFDSTSTYHLSGLFCSATTLANASGMSLPATTVYENSYNDMFNGCSSLTSAPSLPATTLGASCYKRMFRTCGVLSSAPQLPATTLVNECYDNMFRGCSSLTTAPNLPATSLAYKCYRSMFLGCSSLATAPDLLATTLAEDCYSGMFSDCTSLTYAKCLATTNLTGGNTNSMFNGISTVGTFVRAAGASWPCGVIPSTWTVTPEYDLVYRWQTSTDVSDYCCDTTTYTKYYKDYYQVSSDNGCNYQNVVPAVTAQSSVVIEYDSTDCGYVPPVSDYFKITSLAAHNTITLTNNMSGSTVTSFYYSTDDGSTWSNFSLATGQTKTIATLASGDTLMMYGTNDTLGKSYSRGHYFRATGDYEISGEISSLVNGNATDTDLIGKGSYTFAQLFSGDTHIVSAENLKISSTALPQSCFNGTFRSCTRLVKAPELPSTILGKEAYSSMFEGCIALSQPPSRLYFTSAATNDVYARMFCMSRSSKITTPAMTYSPKMFGDWGSTAPVNQQMFCGNGNLTNVYCYWTKSNHSFGTNMTNWLNYTNAGTFTKRSTESFGSGASGIPSNWTTVNDDSTQPS